MSDQRDMEAVIQAARETSTPEDLDPGKPQALIVPPGASLVIPDLRYFKSEPFRPEGEYTVDDVDSFIAYIEQQGLEQSATVWVNQHHPSVVGVLNDHDAGEPGWSDYRLVLPLTPTPEWKYWAGFDGQMLSQVQFAEHIEEGMLDIEEPAAADLLEMAQSFHANTSVTFRSATRLQSGEQQFRYDEEVAATAGRSGEMRIPTQILLNIAPFIGEEGVMIAARFRYRLNNGKLSLGYKLERPDRVRLAAIDKIAEQLKAKFPHTYLGAPRVTTRGVPA